MNYAGNSAEGRSAVSSSYRLPTNLYFSAITLFLFLSFSLLYYVFRPSMSAQYWDSLNYAYSAEASGLRALWGNHPLGHFVLNSVYLLARQFGYAGRALPLFQFVNSLTAGLTVALLFRFSTQSLRNPAWVSLGLALLFGGSYGVGRAAGTADIYTFAMLFSLLSWISLYHDFVSDNRPLLFMSGFVSGLAVLAHQLNGILLLGGLLLAVLHGEYKVQRALSFVGFATVTFAVGTYLAGYLATLSPSLPGILSWSRGHLSDPTWGRYLRVDSLLVALHTAAAAFLHPVGSSDNAKAKVVRAVILVLPGLLLAWGTARSRQLDRARRSFLAGALLQLLGSCPLVIWWEPFNLKFWSLMSVPSAVALGCIAGLFETRTRNKQDSRLLAIPGSRFGVIGALLLPLLGVVVILFNLKFGIIIDHRTDPVYETALSSWLVSSNHDDVLMPADDLVAPLLFWADRPNTVNVYRQLLSQAGEEDRFARLRQTIDTALCGGRAVLYEPHLVSTFAEEYLSILHLSRDSLLRFFDGYEQREAFEYTHRDGKPSKVYALQSAHPCTQ